MWNSWACLLWVHWQLPRAGHISPGIFPTPSLPTPARLVPLSTDAVARQGLQPTSIGYGHCLKEWPKPVPIQHQGLVILYTRYFTLLENAFYFLVFTPLHGIGQKCQYRISHFRDQWITINRLKMYRAEYSLMVECLSNNQKAMGSISSMGVGV